MSSRLCAILLLTFALLLPEGARGAAAMDSTTDSEQTCTLLIRRPGGSDSLSTLKQVGVIDIPDVRDLSVSVMEELLILSGTGRLHHLGYGQTEPEPFDGDLDPRDRIDAVASEGGDWLLLLDRGERLQRLGARGEDLGEIPIPSVRNWTSLRADRSGRIWLVNTHQCRLTAISSGGQELERWYLHRDIMNFKGPLFSWVTDGQGGLYVIEEGAGVIRHLNAAGNSASRRPQRDTLAGAILALSPTGRLIALLDSGCPAGSRFLMWGDSYLLLCDGEIRVLRQIETEVR